jgi:DnaJ-class molecular chaperone
MIPVTLLTLAFGAGYAISLYLWPWRPCPRCHGTRVNRGTTRKRIGMCKRCRGTGRTRRIGATAVHRFYWSVLGDRQLERRRAELDRRRRDAEPPDYDRQ